MKINSETFTFTYLANDKVFCLFCNKIFRYGGGSDTHEISYKDAPRLHHNQIYLLCWASTSNQFYFRRKHHWRRLENDKNLLISVRKIRKKFFLVLKIFIKHDDDLGNVVRVDLNDTPEQPKTLEYSQKNSTLDTDNTQEKKSTENSKILIRF